MLVSACVFACFSEGQNKSFWGDLFFNGGSRRVVISRLRFNKFEFLTRTQFHLSSWLGPSFSQGIFPHRFVLASFFCSTHLHSSGLSPSASCFCGTPLVNNSDFFVRIMWFNETIQVALLILIAANYQSLIPSIKPLHQVKLDTFTVRKLRTRHPEGSYFSPLNAVIWSNQLLGFYNILHIPGSSDSAILSQILSAILHAHFQILWKAEQTFEGVFSLFVTDTGSLQFILNKTLWLRYENCSEKAQWDGKLSFWTSSHSKKRKIIV